MCGTPGVRRACPFLSWNLVPVFRGSGESAVRSRGIRSYVLAPLSTGGASLLWPYAMCRELHAELGGGARR